MRYLRLGIGCIVIAVALMVFIVVDAQGETIQEEFNNKVYTPTPIETSYGFKETSWTVWNVALFTSYVGADIADIYTSQEAFDRGCEEGNPIMPSSTGGMILTKVIIGSIVYYATETWLVPTYGTNARNWMYGTGALIFGAVSVSNNNCGR